MVKKKYVWGILVLAAVAAIVVFVKDFDNRKDNADIAVGGGEANNVQSYVVEPEDEYNRSVRAWITKKRLGGMLDPNGINSSLDVSYTESTPLIEIHCKIRDLDGSIKALDVKSLYIVPVSGSGGGGYGVNGKGLRLELGGDRRSPSGNLFFGTEYNVDGQLPNVEYSSATKLERTRKLKFSTPQSLEAGEICVVELVLVDRIQDKKDNELRAAEAKRRAELEEAEKITIKVSNLPQYSDVGQWVALYAEGARHRSSYVPDAEGKFVINGPNKLGGELALAFSSREKLTRRCWAYIRKLAKRDVNLPEDADIVVTEEDVIEVYLSFEDKDKEALAEYSVVALFESEQGKLPLFYSFLNSGEGFDHKKVKLEVVAGKYEARCIATREKEVSLGTLNISEEVGKVYSVKLPSEK